MDKMEAKDFSNWSMKLADLLIDVEENAKNDRRIDDLIMVNEVRNALLQKALYMTRNSHF